MAGLTHEWWYWFDLMVPAVNSILLFAVVMHLYRTSRTVRPPQRCLITNENTCLVFGRGARDLGLCEQCTVKIRERAKGAVDGQ